MRRSNWSIVYSKTFEKLKKPVKYVIIHDTPTRVCHSRKACLPIIRNLQALHRSHGKIGDIAYNFLISADGVIYEGRGMDSVGGHLDEWNDKSYGIAFIGKYKKQSVTDAQISSMNKLIDSMVKGGHLASDYKLLSRDQLDKFHDRSFALMANIKTWPHWAKEP